ncbi:MAG: hypothetical protein WC823_06935 [Parcubacteria group bacterium]|jgi:Tfp pilus assembly protein PilO
MKLKILIFPAIVVTLLYFAIWVIIPKYSGAGGIMDTQKKLADAKEKLAGVVQKEANAASLVQDLNNNSEEQNILVKYLPEKKQDEDVVVSINAIAGTSGVALDGMKMEEAANISETQVVYDASGNVVPTVIDPIKGFMTEITISGNYAQLRQFIFSLDTINRLNEMTVLKISSDEVGLLKATLRVKFNYFEKAATVVAVRDEFFAQSKFDMSIANDIKKRATLETPRIDIGTIGRENLFAL